MLNFKRIAKFLVLSVFSLMVFVIGGSWIYHTNAIKKEIASTPAPGKMVDVNDHAMHVYSEGNGEQTIVFLSGGGTSAPVLDFKPLWSELSPTYKIAVVEKAGYGWSDIADVSREIDVILEESRTALSLAGMQPPYILAAHSMSGLEAIRWAQIYPEEVEAIIGLDPAIPESYSMMKLPSKPVKIMGTLFARSGMIRLVPSIANSSAAIQSGELSEEDMETYRSVFYRRTATANMLDEMDHVRENAEIVNQSGIPIETPMYFFISDGKEVGIASWREMLTDYIGQLKHGNYIYMDAGHYLHAWEPKLIAEEIKDFINQ